MKSKQDNFWEAIQDRDFRHEIIEAHVNEGVAFQIRS